MDDKAKTQDEKTLQASDEQAAQKNDSPETGWSTQINDKVEKSRKGRVGRILRRSAALVLAAAVLFVAWGYLSPLVTADTVTTYASYTAETGAIATTMSYSGTISVRYQETLRNEEAATVSAIYVSEGDNVKKGDVILALSTGTQLSATMDGIVNSIDASLGDWLWRSRDLVQICNLTDLEVALTVDEYDVQKVSVGQPCTVTIISTGDVFETEIAHINKVSAATGSVATYSATAYMTAPEHILPGMAATVTMASQSADNAVLLDLAALSFHDDGSAYVLLKQSDGTYGEQDVTTGLTDGMKAEIVSGVEAGQQVWVVDGTESVSSGYTLSDIYQALMGQTVVINPSSERGSRGGTTGSFTKPNSTATDSDISLPEGFNPTSAGGDLPEGFDPTSMGGEMPEGFDPTSGDTGMTPPEGFTPSSGDAATDTSDTSESTAASEETTTSADTGENQRQRPDGSGGTGGQRPDQSGTSSAEQNAQGGNGE